MKMKTILRKLNTLEKKPKEEKELTPKNTQASYGKKAYTYTLKIGETLYRVLKSYNTFVCIVELNKNENFYFEEHSNTTMRHIKTFLDKEEESTKKLRSLNNG